MSLIYSDIGMCDMSFYDMIYKYRTIRDLDVVLKYNFYKLFCNNIVFVLLFIFFFLLFLIEGI